MGLLTPSRYVTDVTVIDLDEQWRRGKRALLLDRDNTIVPRDTKVAPPEVVAWVDHAHELGFKVCFVSNNWTRNVKPDADRFGAELVAHAVKPVPFALWYALHKLHVKRRETLLIGDQVFTDLLGGKLSGIDMVLVEPQTDVDLAHTLLLRKLESHVLSSLEPERASADPSCEHASDASSAS